MVPSSLKGRNGLRPISTVCPASAEAKALVDGAPKPVLEHAKKEDAEKAKAQLEEAGSTRIIHFVVAC